jgi:hypothetical protein
MSLNEPPVFLTVAFRLWLLELHLDITIRGRVLLAIGDCHRAEPARIKGAGRLRLTEDKEHETETETEIPQPG